MKNIRLDDDLNMVRGPYKTKPIQDRLAEGRSIAASGCWEWTGKRNQFGYGRIYWRGREWYTHRLVLMLDGIDIPDEMQVDHLCRNRICFNPAHLDIVTPRVNTYRGSSPSALNAVKSHCIRGHEFTPENTRLTPRPKGRIRRVCRECARQGARKRYQARMATRGDA